MGNINILVVIKSCTNKRTIKSETNKRNKELVQTGFTKAATNPKEVMVTPENCRWSRVLVTGEVKGHECSIRDAYNAADLVSQDRSRVLQCPLCFQGSNNEFQLFIKFTIVLSARLEIMLRDWSFLESTLLDLQSRS